MSLIDLRSLEFLIRSLLSFPDLRSLEFLITSLSQFIFGFCIIVGSYIPVLNILTLTTGFVNSLGVLYKNVVQFTTLLARNRALQWRRVRIVQLHKYARNLTQLLTNQLTLQTVKHTLSYYPATR